MKFSVIIPVYNKSMTICSAVESIYAQTCKDFEILIVDDGSTDAIDDALNSLHGVQHRLIHRENGGVSRARNTGLAHAQGEYVCFLDADDLWKSDHLETLRQLIEKYPQADMFVTSNEVVFSDERIHHSNEALKSFDLDFETDDFLGLLNRTSYAVVNTNSVCIRRSVMEQEGIRFEPGIKIGEDTDVWFRVGLNHKVAISKKETTVYRREHSTATSATSHIQNWIFSQRIPEILADEQISEKVKASVVQLIDRYKMTSSREYMASGNRSEAKRVLAEVINKRGKRYILTKVFTCLPCSFCERILRAYSIGL